METTFFRLTHFGMHSKDYKGEILAFEDWWKKYQPTKCPMCDDKSLQL